VGEKSQVTAGQYVGEGRRGRVLTDRLKSNAGKGRV